MTWDRPENYRDQIDMHGGPSMFAYEADNQVVEISHQMNWKGAAVVRIWDDGELLHERAISGALAKKAFCHGGRLESMAQDAPKGSEIVEKCFEIAELLVDKNRKYGDSALNPVRVFSEASTEEQILVRMDDKLSRIQSGQTDDDEDSIMDLVGYLILLLIQRDGNDG